MRPVSSAFPTSAGKIEVSSEALTSRGSLGLGHKSSPRMVTSDNVTPKAEDGEYAISAHPYEAPDAEGLS